MKLTEQQLRDLLDALDGAGIVVTDEDAAVEYAKRHLLNETDVEVE